MDTLQKNHLVEMGKWQNVIGIIIAIVAGFLALLGVGIIITGASAGSLLDLEDELAPFSGALGAAFGFVFLVAALLYFFFARYLLLSAKSIKAWSINPEVDDANLTDGLKNSKSFFKLGGILLLIYLGLMVFVALGVIIGLTSL